MTKTLTIPEKNVLKDFQTDLVAGLKSILKKIETAKKENEIKDCIDLLKNSLQKQIINCNVIEKHIEKMYNKKEVINNTEPPEKIPGW